jgi:hypothetical protein
MREADLEMLLADLSPETRRVALALRKVVRRLLPQAEESMLWGGLSYHRPQVGGRVKGAVCQIVFKRDQVRLDFIHGVRLTDPVGLLQGNLVSKRYVPIQTIADAQRPEIAALVQEAAALDPTQCNEEDREGEFA